MWKTFHVPLSLRREHHWSYMPSIVFHVCFTSPQYLSKISLPLRLPLSVDAVLFVMVFDCVQRLTSQKEISDKQVWKMPHQCCLFAARLRHSSLEPELRDVYYYTQLHSFFLREIEKKKIETLQYVRSILYNESIQDSRFSRPKSRLVSACLEISNLGGALPALGTSAAIVANPY